MLRKLQLSDIDFKLGKDGNKPTPIDKDDGGGGKRITMEDLEQADG